MSITNVISPKKENIIEICEFNYRWDDRYGRDSYDNIPTWGCNLMKIDEYLEDYLLKNDCCFYNEENRIFSLEGKTLAKKNFNVVRNVLLQKLTESEVEDYMDDLGIKIGLYESIEENLDDKQSIISEKIHKLCGVELHILLQFDNFNIVKKLLPKETQTKLELLITDYYNLTKIK